MKLLHTPHRSYLATVLFCSLCLQTKAQTSVASPPQSTDTVEEIVITANPLRTRALVQPVQRIDAQQAMLQSASTLGDTLADLPGVSSSSFGAASRPVIRGQDGDRIRVLNNGASSSDVSGLSSDHAVSDHPLGAEKIEVLRGPAALMYGGSAMGGVINLLDDRIRAKALFDKADGKLGRAMFGLGTAASESISAGSVQAGNADYTLKVDAYTKNANAVAVPKQLSCTQTGVTQNESKICNSQAKAQGAGLGFSRHFATGYWGSSVQTNQQQYGSVAEDKVNLQMRAQRLRLEGGLQNYANLANINSNLTLNRYAHNEIDSGAVSTQFKSYGSDLRVQAQLKDRSLGSHTSIDWKNKNAFGWQREVTRFSAVGSEAFVPNTHTQTQALYWLGSVIAPEPTQMAHTVTYGLRHESAQVRSDGIDGNTSFSPHTRQLSSNSLALGGVLDARSLMHGLQASADWSRYGRIPKDYELYANGEHVATKAFEIGNKTLDVERATHTELGLRWHSENKKTSTALNVYQTQFQNYIYLRNLGTTSTKGNPNLEFTQAPARFTGWEWQGAIPLGYLQLSSHISQVEATNQATSEPLPRIPARKTGLTLQNLGQDSRLGKWQWSISALHYAAQNKYPSGQQAVGSYNLFNTRTTLSQNTMFGKIQWFISANNLTNTLAYPSTSILTHTAAGRVPLAGRDIRVGVSLDF